MDEQADKAMEIAEAIVNRFWIQDGVAEDAMNVTEGPLADFIRPLLSNAAHAAGVAEGLKRAREAVATLLQTESWNVEGYISVPSPKRVRLVGIQQAASAIDALSSAAASADAANGQETRSGGVVGGGE